MNIGAPRHRRQAKLALHAAWRCTPRPAAIWFELMAHQRGFSIATPALPAARREALDLVFSRFDAQQAAEYRAIYEGAIEEGTVRPEWVLEARGADRLLGAALYHLQPGRTALVWPPRLAPKAPPSVLASLMTTMVECLQSSGVRLATALLHRVEPEDGQLLGDWQFTHIADLIYLVSFRQDFPFSPPPTELDFEAYGPQNHARLANVVQATYEASLDCPALDGVRDIEDVLAGYRGAGRFVPDHWAIVRHQGKDVGCVLLADHPRQDSCELAYMGITAPVRGRGWGRQVVRWAQWRTRQAGRGRLLLAVDAGNAPALAMYADVGFFAWDRRQCYARVLGP